MQSVIQKKQIESFCTINSKKKIKYNLVDREPKTENANVEDLVDRFVAYKMQEIGAERNNR